MLGKISVKKPYYVIVGIVLALVLGYISFTRMTTDLLPSMNFPYVIVYVTDPGATPEQIESDLTRPLESSFATLTDIKEITSQSSDSLALVVMEFNDTADMNTAMIEINSAITALQAQWSDSVGAPVIMKINPDMLPVSIVSVSRDDMDIVELSRYVNETLIPKYESINGVARVTASGLITPEVDVTIEQDRIDIINSAVLRDVDAELADVEQQLNDAQAQISEGKAMLARTKRAIMGKLNSAGKMLDEGETQMGETLTQLKAQREELAAQLQQVNDGLAQLEALPTLTEEQKAVVTALQSQLGDLEARRQQLQQELEKVSQGGGTEEVAAQIAALEAQREDYVTERDRLNAAIADLESADAGAIQSEIDALQAQRDEALNEAQTAHDAANAAEEDLRKSDTRIDTLRKQIAEREGSAPTQAPVTEAPTGETQTAAPETNRPADTPAPAETDAPDPTDAPAETDRPEETEVPEPTGSSEETEAPQATESAAAPEETDAPEETPAADISSEDQGSDAESAADDANDAEAGEEDPAPPEEVLSFNELSFDLSQNDDDGLWSPFFASAAEKSLEELRRELSEEEAARDSLQAEYDRTRQAWEEKQRTVDNIEAQLAQKQAALEALQSGNAEMSLETARRELQRVESHIARCDAELNALKGVGEGQSSVADTLLERMKDLDEQIEALKNSDQYKMIELLLNDDERAQKYAEAVAAKAQLETGLEQMDAAIEKLEKGIIPGGTIEGYDQDMTLEEARSALSSARSQALSAFSDAEAQLNDASAQLAEARKEFEDNRDEALKNAGIDGIITVQTVAGIIGAQNLSMPAGYVYDADEDQYMVRVGDKFTRLDELRDLKLFSLGLDSVDEVRLSDVARVEITDNSEDQFTKVDGLDGILLSIEKQSTWSTTDVADRVAKRSQELMNETVGLNIVDMFNQGEYINIIVDSVLSNLVYGGLLAILVLLIFLLDWRPTLIVALSIPLSVVIAFVCMYFSNITLNVLSLSGLALGIGMLVDNSIVAIENIFRLHNEEKVPILHACVQGVNQVGGSLFASTLTTICVFVPVLFVTGMAHDLFMDLGLTIAYSLLASLVVAMTVVPSMAASLMKRNRMNRENGLFSRFQRSYVALLRGALRLKPLVILAALALLAFTVLQVPKMGISFMPEVNSTQMSATMALDEEAELKPQQDKALQLMEDMMAIPGIQTVGLTGGSGISALMSSGDALTYYIIVDEDAGRANAEIAEDLRSLAEGRAVDLSIETSTMDISMLTGSGVSIEISGEDSDTLADIARDVAEIVGKVPGTAEVDDGLQNAVPQIRITVDKEKAADKNLTVGQILQFLGEKLAGKTEITQATFDGSEMSVYIIDGRNQSITPEDLQDLEIEVTSGDTSEMVRIGDVAEVSEGDGFATIRRDGQRRTVTVSFQAAEGQNLNHVSDAVEEALTAYVPPQGYEIQLAGENETVMQIMNDLMFMLAVAVLLIFLIMVGQFQSFKSPLIVMFTIPLAFTGGLLALIVTGMDLSIVAVIGFLVLSGVIVNNGIVFVDTVNQLRVGGMAKKQALLETGRMRLRPILMTALTTILGMSLMAMARGMGAEMMQPMAVVVVGGLSYATLMTLFIVPCLYDLFNGEKMNAREIRMAEEAAGIAHGEDMDGKAEEKTERAAARTPAVEEEVPAEAEESSADAPVPEAEKAAESDAIVQAEPVADTEEATVTEPAHEEPAPDPVAAPAQPATVPEEPSASSQPTAPIQPAVPVQPAAPVQPTAPAQTPAQPPTTYPPAAMPYPYYPAPWPYAQPMPYAPQPAYPYPVAVPYGQPAPTPVPAAPTAPAVQKPAPTRKQSHAARSGARSRSRQRIRRKLDEN